MESMQEKIDRYLNNELKGTELETFERQLQEDDALAAEVALLKDMEEAVEDRYLDEVFAPKLRAMSQDYFKEAEVKASPAKSSKTNRLLFILIGMSVLAGLGLLIWQSFSGDTTEKVPPKIETEQIFAANFQPYQVDNLQRSGTATEAIDYQAALEVYKAKDYAVAIPLLEKALTATPNDSDIKMLLGNSYLSATPINTAAAIDIFKPLAENDASLYQEEAQWYLALAYLKNKQAEAAQLLLQILADKGIGKYPKLAKAVLEQL